MTLLRFFSARPTPLPIRAKANHTQSRRGDALRPAAQAGWMALAFSASSVGAATAQEAEPHPTCYMIVAGAWSGSVKTEGRVPCDCEFSSGVGVDQGDGTLVAGSGSSGSGSYCDSVVTAYPPYHELQPGGQLSTTVSQSQSATVQLGSCQIAKSSGFLGLFASCRAVCQYSSFQQSGFNLYAYNGSCQGNPPPQEASVPSTFGPSPW